MGMVFAARTGPLGSAVHFWEYSASQDDLHTRRTHHIGPKDAFDRRFESAGKPRQDKKGSRAQTWCKSVLRSVAASPDVTPS